MPNVMLPNGVMMSGVPEGTSWEKVAKSAVQQGVATPEDFKGYPDIYAQLKPLSNTPTTAPQPSSVGMDVLREQGRQNAIAASSPHGQSMADGLAQQSEALRQSLGKTAQERWGSESPEERHRDIETVTGLASGVLALTGIGIPAAMAIGAAGTTAGDSVATGITTGGKSFAPEHIGEDVLLGAGGGALPGVVTGSKAAVKALTERLTPRTAAYLKGVLEGGLPAKPGIVWQSADKPPVTTEPEILDDVLPVNPKAEEQVTSTGLDEIRAEQALHDQKMQQLSVHRLSSIEASSYMRPMLEQSESGKIGKTPAAALQMYRDFTKGYRHSAVPHAGTEEGLDHLANMPYYEARMRADNPALHRIVTAIDAGEKVDADEFLNALASYDLRTKFDVMDYAARLPASYADHLIGLMRDAPDVDRWLTGDVLDNALSGKVTTLSKKMVEDYRNGIRDVMQNEAEGLQEAISKEYAVARDRFMIATDEGEKNLATALDHKMKALTKMNKSVQHFAETGEWKGGIDADDEAIYQAMALTHDEARNGLLVMEKFRRLRSLGNAQPVVGEQTGLDAMADRTADLISGVLTVKTGGAGAVAAPVVRKTVRAAARKVRRNVIKGRAELAAAAKEAAKNK
ncbi:Uncharacterised protein [Serratia quinivorans]|uniref:Uncharacterized protein n=1 Tax=Serratia quinivorans TaxID=137545 RepID=A0A380AUZ8_9GAMM|nr:hypothetical protein [Serratia proteamaculans]RYM60178.1 hypothetical protein BSR03_17190 [Serratia proteamaculans]SUI88268.1 Uncharacterised protein [Serratia quinivorans]